jgi:DNA repair photolyase
MLCPELPVYGAAAMGAVDNPPNPFERRRCQYEATPPAAAVVVREELAVSILSTNCSPDIPYRWSVNPYRGCQHGCAYCYARRTHEYLDLGAGTDFNHQLTVKVNAPELLDVALSSRRWLHECIAFSGVTDCYQPLEERYRLTRRCLEVCVKHANPVSVVTKSPLVVRDVDLLAELHRRRGASVLLSITFADDDLARRIEPGAPPPSARFDAVRRLGEAGVPVGVLLAPIIPGLNDRCIPEVLRRAAECGATCATYAPVRLPGSVAPVFLSHLRREMPEAAARVEARIRDMRDGLLNNPQFGRRMAGSGPYWESVERLFEVVATRVGLYADQEWREASAAATCAAGKQLLLF